MSKELIDRKQIPYLLVENEEGTKPEGVTLCSIIDKMATVDAVEVVRCKDCKYNVANITTEPLDATDYSGADIVCSYFMTDGLYPDGFCSYGERQSE